MGLDKTRRITDVVAGNDSAGGIEQVNRLLRSGWTLIEHYVDFDGSGDERRPVPHYVLASESDVQQPDSVCDVISKDGGKALRQAVSDRLSADLASLGLNPEDASALVAAMTQGGEAGIAIAIFIATQIAALEQKLDSAIGLLRQRDSQPGEPA